MKKITNPCKCKVHDGRRYDAFCKIEYTNGRLSITGVIGPMRNGNCKGGAGQCVDEVRSGTPTGGWTSEMLNKFCNIWDTWHLNDLRPYCEHQKALGWDKEAMEKVTLYHYRLNRDAIKKQDAAKNAAMAALRKGETFSPSNEQAFYAALAYSYDTFDELNEQQKALYEPRKPLYDGDNGASEIVTRGWTLYDCHPQYGILDKPCPVCGYKYGHGWKMEEVPQGVIDWLWSLPEPKKAPAWC